MESVDQKSREGLLLSSKSKVQQKAQQKKKGLRTTGKMKGRRYNQRVRKTFHIRRTENSHLKRDDAILCACVHPFSSHFSFFFYNAVLVSSASFRYHTSCAHICISIPLKVCVCVLTACFLYIAGRRERERDQGGFNTNQTDPLILLSLPFPSLTTTTARWCWKSVVFHHHCIDRQSRSMYIYTHTHTKRAVENKRGDLLWLQNSFPSLFSIRIQISPTHVPLTHHYV